MERTRRTVSELASLFRMLQVIPEAEGIPRVYSLLLAFCTTWRTIGFERAFLFLVQPEQGVIRGHLSAEQAPAPDDAPPETPDDESFESLAKRVFDNFEQLDSSDLTLRTRSFTIPLDWRRSAVVKTAVSGFPTLADRQASEFASDPFLGFFDTRAYVAFPIRVRGTVTAVLAADNARSGTEIDVQDVSLVYSLVQHAALAIERLLEAGDSRRQFRILHKLQHTLRAAETPEQLAEGLNLALSMICRAVGGTGCFLKDFVRGRTLHVKTVDEYTLEAEASDLAVGECFERILDRAAGTVAPVKGDSGHALIDGATAESVAYFYATPLAVTGESHGALAVYAARPRSERGPARRRGGFAIRERNFLDLCAATIAAKLDQTHKADRIGRYEAILDEIRTNLARERAECRAAQRAVEFLDETPAHLAELAAVLRGPGTADERVARADRALSAIEDAYRAARRDVESKRLGLRMTDLFALVARVVEAWRPRVERNGVEVTVRIPERGPALLMNAGRIEEAFAAVFRTLTSCVTENDRVLVECRADEQRALVCIADTGEGLPGHLLSRLFMPFTGMDARDERGAAMSLAGEILQQHGGEIHIRSTASWKTVLVLAFPLAANRDRRRRGERRRKRDRRRPQPAGTG